MVDNVAANTSDSGGATFATDDVSTVHYPIGKIAYGALNSVTLASSGTGTDDAGTQRVTLATDINLPTGPVTNAGTFAVQVDGAALTALQLIDDPVFADNAAFTLSTSKVSVQGGVYQNGTPGTLADNDAGAILLNSTAGQMVELMASSAAIGVVDLGANNDVTATLDAETTKVIGSVISAAAATGGMSFTQLGIAAADNDVVIKASAATVYFISIQSLDATPVYLKLFNLASFTPGTSSASMQFMCPANSTAANGAGVVLNFGAQGIQFDTGLCALIATGFALADNTAVSANEVIVQIGWE